MPSNVRRRARASMLTQYRAAPDSFVLTPGRQAFGQLQPGARAFDQDNSFPVFKVAKQTEEQFSAPNAFPIVLKTAREPQVDGKRFPALHVAADLFPLLQTAKQQKDDQINIFPGFKAAKQSSDQNNTLLVAKQQQQEKENKEKENLKWRFEKFQHADSLLSSERTQRHFLPIVRTMTRREDTFDSDFMMPERVREVLQDEGLERHVINNVIGHGERKYQRTLQHMSGLDRCKLKDYKPRGQALSPPVVTTNRHNVRIHVPKTAVGPTPNDPFPPWLDLTCKNHAHHHSNSSESALSPKGEETDNNEVFFPYGYTNDDPCDKFGKYESSFNERVHKKERSNFVEDFISDPFRTFKGMQSGKRKPLFQEKRKLTNSPEYRFLYQHHPVDSYVGRKLWEQHTSVDPDLSNNVVPKHTSNTHTA